MTSAQFPDAPPLEDQEIDGFGVWRAANPMVWEPADESDPWPRGPLRPQEHESGAWIPSAGGVMSWFPNDAPDAGFIEIVDAPGDEDQNPPDDEES